MKKLIPNILKALECGENAALAVVVQSSGSTPRKIGSAMAVFANGSSLGTVGGGAIEHEVMRVCRDEVIGDPESSASRELGYSLVPNGKGDLKMVCGGDVTLQVLRLTPDSEVMAELRSAQSDSDVWFCIIVQPDGNARISVCGAEGNADIAPKCLGRRARFENGIFTLPLRDPGFVYIFGGGHVGRALCDTLSRTGFACVVFDDREQFSSQSEHPLAARTICGDFENISRHVEFTESDYVIVVTRGHEYDYVVLTQTLPSKAMYVGCMGSRRKMIVIRERLTAEAMLDERTVARLYSPIGIEIGAETPEELAISIAAELIQVRASAR